MSDDDADGSGPRPLYLCAGCQSSGSSLVSWCFLQRADMDGMFDARGDALPEIPLVQAPLTWCKITIQCFRFSEMADHYRDAGWEVRPLLVVRDVRAVFNSLITKHYGSNGTTAEQPPLRMRLRRFKEDWEQFRRNGWPIIRHESLVTDGEPVLRQCVADMGLPWDDGMLTWPKHQHQMADPAHGSPTLRASMGASFAATTSPQHAEVRTAHVPPADLLWLEEEFAEFNAANGYAAHVAPDAQWTDPLARAVPSYANTHRYRREQRHERWNRALTALPRALGLGRGRRRTEERRR